MSGEMPQGSGTLTLLKMRKNMVGSPSITRKVECPAAHDLWGHGPDFEVLRIFSLLTMRAINRVLF